MILTNVTELDDKLLVEVDGGGKWTNAAGFCAAAVGSASETIVGASMINPLYGVAVGAGACIYGGFFGYVLTPGGN